MVRAADIGSDLALQAADPAVGGAHVDWARQESLADVFDRLGLAYIAVDAVGHVRVWNDGAVRLYGWPAAEAIGRPILELNCGPSSQVQARQVLAALEAGLRWEGEFEACRRDGSPIDVYVIDTPLLDDEGRSIATIGVSFERTAASGRSPAVMARELISVAATARAQERARAAALAHDRIGQPLAMARSMLHDGLGSAASGEVLGRMVDLLEEAADGLGLLLESLEPADRAADDLTAELSRALRAAGDRAGWQGTQLIVSPGLAIGSWPLALRRLVRRAVLRSLSNVERHAAATQVVVQLVQHGGDIVVEVVDDGVGPGDLRPGYGLLGLQREAHHLGGSLQVRRAGGAGTLIQLRVPRAAPSAVERPAPRRRAAG